MMVGFCGLEVINSAWHAWVNSTHQVSSYNDFMGFYSDLMGFYSDFSIQGLVNVLIKHRPHIGDISSPTNT